ncbi:MAG: bifunctional folylpolyglutamate synthase/dihydrofolate synthase [Thermodesulfovibrionales bacterium]|nr:bifunctional folylpolyglutamate synthase/dihydrofolate synthase [Thermodesulfovibrionales bacterium]
MSSKYKDSIDYLYGLQKHGIKLGLDRTRLILSALGNPQRNFRSVHIAGTNGKGSVSAMIASILKSRGFKVGLFTSPHLVSFTERISINGVEIAESEVVQLTDEIKTVISSLTTEIPTFFEFVTAMAFLYFSRNKIDWGVIEVGMGGRLDCTNVIIPEVSVITRISYDHKEFLGNTLTEIAKEKAGIIKKTVPVIASSQEDEAKRVIEDTALRQSSRLYLYDVDFKGNLVKSDLHGITFEYRDKEVSESLSSKYNFYVPLAGEHQLINASVAIKASKLLLQKFTKDPQDSIFESIKGGLSQTRWRGRLELLRQEPPIMIDGAHNPDAAEKLSVSLKKLVLPYYEIILVTGIMLDKDIRGILKPLLPLCSEIIFTAPNYGRAASPKVLSDIALSEGFDSKIAPTIKQALEMAISIASQIMHPDRKRPLILITGSFYTIGEALEILGEKSTLGDLREKI